MNETRRQVLQLIVASGTLAGVKRRAIAQSSGILKRPIPRSGERLPAVGVGTWQTFDVGADAAERAELKEVLRLLVEGGGSVVDSSPMYGRSEAVTGDLSVTTRTALAPSKLAIWIRHGAAR